MHKIVVTSKKFDGSLELEFDQRGVIKRFVNNASMTDEQLDYLRRCFPTTMEVMKHIAQHSQTMKVKFINADLSFAHFWDAYHYKRGRKAEAEKLWKKLSDAEKHLALEAIPLYDGDLIRNPRGRVYPERFIKNRYWENDFNS